MVEIRPEDYRAEVDSEALQYEAMSPLITAIKDFVHHRMGDDWDPWAKPGDVPALLAEVREIIEPFEEAVRTARAEIASVERTARLAAIRREKAEARHG